MAMGIHVRPAALATMKAAPPINPKNVKKRVVSLLFSISSIQTTIRGAVAAQRVLSPSLWTSPTHTLDP